jgi:CRISPR system Cascade subunit CasD
VSGRRATLFLRLEGPLQSWGGRTIGRFRRTEPVPTKSGVFGLLGAALGLERRRFNERLREFDALRLAVRVDRAGSIAQDFQTVGARLGVIAADGKVKKTASTGQLEAIVSPREFLVDASFLAILEGPAGLIEELGEAVRRPVWPLYLGRKRCIPGTPVFAGIARDLDLADALLQDGPQDQPLRPADESETVRVVTDLLDEQTFARLAGDDGAAPPSYEQAKAYWTDRLVRQEPPVHAGRIVLDFHMKRPALARPPLDFDPQLTVDVSAARTAEAKKRARAKAGNRCVFCHYTPPDPRELHAHHVTYERRGRERVGDAWSTEGDDLVMLCAECHAAVTMLEYRRGFGMHRIDPRDPRWNGRIREAREALRRWAGLGHFPMAGAAAAEFLPRSPFEVYESTLNLAAGSAYPPDSPANYWLVNLHFVHQRLSMAFPQAGGVGCAAGYGVPRQEGGFLFRVQWGERASILVRSRLLPDWSRALGKAAWLTGGRRCTIRRFDAGAFEAGQELAFDLVANAVKRLAAPDGGPRVGLHDEQDLRNWLERKAEAGGFAVRREGLEITPLGRLFGRLRHRPVRCWDGVQYRGRLVVRDRELFAKTLINGIGHAKAFGFGLLSVARPA